MERGGWGGIPFSIELTKVLVAVFCLFLSCTVGNIIKIEVTWEGDYLFRLFYSEQSDYTLCHYE